MTSDQIENTHEAILKELLSANSVKVIEALEELRVSGKTSDIPFLLELLHSSQNVEIKSKITGLLGNLKEKDSVPIIIEAIQNQEYEPELKQLVSCCWENGLDYSMYLSVFVELLIDRDFLVAFEAYTVITNIEKTIDQAIIDIEIEKLDQAMRATTDEKKALMLDVIDFLPSIGF